RAVLRDRPDRVRRGDSTDVLVVPSRVGDEVEQTLMRGVGAPWIGTCTRRDGLHALALTVAQDAHGIDSERLAPTVVAELFANLAEIAFQSSHRGVVHQILHELRRSRA